MWNSCTITIGPLDDKNLIAKTVITKNKLKAKKILKNISIGEDALQIQEVKFRKTNGWNWRLGKMRFEKAIHSMRGMDYKSWNQKKNIGWNKTNFFLN